MCIIPDKLRGVTKALPYNTLQVEYFSFPQMQVFQLGVMLSNGVSETDPFCLVNNFQMNFWPFYVLVKWLIFHLNSFFKRAYRIGPVRAVKHKIKINKSYD